MTTTTDPYILPRAIRDGAQYSDQHRLAAALTAGQCAALVGAFDRLTAQAAELDRFMPQPMSQLCRDGDHGRDCVGCDCLCHWHRADRDRLAAQVQRMRDWADKMEAEAPKPAPGGFFADEVRRVLDGGAK